MKLDPMTGDSLPAFTRCSIYLLKPDITTSFEALTVSAKKQYEKQTPLYKEPEHEIFKKVVHTPKPKWLKNVEALCRLPVFNGDMTPVSSSALIFLRAGSRLFALTFGHGWKALKMEAVDLEFGYEAANRLLDRTKIDSAFSCAIDGSAMNSLKKVFQGTGIGRYGFNQDTESLRALSGASIDDRFGEHITGSTPFLLQKESTLPEIKVICEDLLKVLASNTPRVWKNNTSLVRDKRLEETLDVELGRYLAAGHLHNVSIAPPDDLSFNGSLRIEDGTPFTNLFNLEKYLLKVKGTKSLTKKTLSGIVINEHADDGGAFAERWSLWECLDVVFDYDNAQYCLKAGEWYKFDPDYIQDLNALIDTIALYEGLPNATNEDTEPTYNKRAGDTKHMYYFDTDLVKGKGYREGAEICDLLTEEGNLVHVKFGTKSSLMSHLFNQGSQAAFQSRVSYEFRQECIAKLRVRGIPEELIRARCQTRPCGPAFVARQ